MALLVRACFRFDVPEDLRDPVTSVVAPVCKSASENSGWWTEPREEIEI